MPDTHSQSTTEGRVVVKSIIAAPAARVAGKHTGKSNPKETAALSRC